MVEVTVEGRELTTKEYPYIGSLYNLDVYVLFIGVGCGTVIASDCHEIHPLGKYSDEWFEGDFIKFNGGITLKNS